MKHIGGVMAGMGNPQPHGAPGPYAGGVLTKQGWFSYEEILEAGGSLTEDSYGCPIVVQFPTWSDELGRHMRVIPDHKLKEGGDG